MLKKKCFAALSGILLAITVIAPFSFSKVDAAVERNANVRVLYSYTASAETDGAMYLYADVIFTSSYLSSGSIYFRYKNTISNQSYGLYDGIGVYTNPTYETNGDYRTYTLTFTNTAYFVYRIVFKGQAAVLNLSVLQNPAASTTLGFSFGLNDVTYTAVPANENEIAWQMKSYLESINNYQISIINLVNTTNSRLTTIDSNIRSLLNGNTNSNNAVTNNDELNSSAVNVIDEYDELNSTFDSNFMDSQEDMQNIMSNSSLTAFSDAAIWFTAQLANLYTSMGDMQILVTLPLLLGIALFFIGRGNVIFKDPNTETWTESYIHDTLPGNEEYFSKRQVRTYTHKNRTKAKVHWF